MIEDRKMKLVSEIVKTISSMRSEDEAGIKIASDLLEKGYTIQEINEAFNFISSTMKEIPFELPAIQFASPNSELRSLSKHEEAMFTDEALELYREWKKLELLTSEEEEELLQRVLQSEAGAVDRDALWAVAAESVRKGSKLHLHVSTRFSARH